MAVSRATLERHLVQVRRIAEHREVKAEQNIRYYFSILKKDLNSFLGSEYAQLAQDDKLTYAILQQKGEYARFLEEVINKVDGISPKIQSEVQKLIEETYKTCYKGLVDGVTNISDISQLAKEFKTISAIPAETVKRAVQNPIKKLTLTAALEKKVSGIRREIAVGLTQGDRMSTMARRISKYVDQNYRKSMLIARTEAHRVREGGFNDAADAVDRVLTDNDSEYRMTKTWETMTDSAVRHTNLANHVKMEGITVLQDEDFTLSNGSHAPCPGSSGVAAQDCNCRCYLSRHIMNDEEYYKKTGKHFSVKAFTNRSKHDIISSKGGKIMNINNIDSPIEQRNTGKGNPNAIIHAGRPLNNRQKTLLEKLPNYNSSITVRKNTVNMKDLSALTAYTGDEFALFTKGQERLIIRGNSNSVKVDVTTAKSLSAQGYKWSGHTHPGIGINCLQASPGDKDILNCFKQKVAYIYNSQGEYLEFWKE